MVQQIVRTDFEWSDGPEPHATRRKEILAKYPQVKKLMGSDPNLKYAVVGMVLAQLLAAWFLRDASWGLIFVVAYVFGGTVNHSMTLAIHEIAHNLAFGHGKPLANRLLGIFGNLPLGIPYSITFKKYHLEHHRYQGDDDRDVDIPTRIEAKLFRNTATKILWVILQPFFYALRPLAVRPKSPNWLEGLNLLIQIVFDIIILATMGPRSLIYLTSGTFLAMGLHPVAGHFISEHYMFVKGFETYSYYGPLNAITFNVGYHNEHHDFPSIPGSRLPELKKIAPEYYTDLPCHHSWVRVIYDFITDPEMSLYSRIKRKENGDAAVAEKKEDVSNKQE